MFMIGQIEQNAFFMLSWINQKNPGMAYRDVNQLCMTTEQES